MKLTLRIDEKKSLINISSQRVTVDSDLCNIEVDTTSDLTVNILHEIFEEFGYDVCIYYKNNEDFIKRDINSLDQEMEKYTNANLE